MRATSDFGTFSAPLPFLQRPANPHTQARAHKLSARWVIAQPDRAHSARRVRAASGTPLPEDRLEEEDAGRRKSRRPGRRSTRPGARLGARRRAIAQSCVSRAVHVEEEKPIVANNPARYECSSEGKGFGKSEHGRSSDDSSMGCRADSIRMSASPTCCRRTCSGRRRRRRRGRRWRGEGRERPRARWHG